MRRHRSTRLLPVLEFLEARAALSGIVGVAPSAAILVRGATDRAEIRRNVPYTVGLDGTRRLLDVYTPAGTPPTGGRPVILAIHGGGWRRMSKEDYGRAVSEFTKYGYIVVAPNYQLSSPGKPSDIGAVSDLRAAVRWIRSNAAGLGADPNRVVAMGESAGGNLAALLGVETDPATRVQAVVDFYGPTDLFTLDQTSRTGGLALRQFIGGAPTDLPTRARAVSPAMLVTAAAAPMFIAQGLNDPVVPPDQSSELADALSARGIRNQLVWVPNTGHGFRFRAGGIDFLPLILAFLDTTWNDDGYPPDSSRSLSIP